MTVPRICAHCEGRERRSNGLSSGGQGGHQSESASMLAGVPMTGQEVNPIFQGFISLVVHELLSLRHISLNEARETVREWNSLSNVSFEFRGACGTGRSSMGVKRLQSGDGRVRDEAGLQPQGVALDDRATLEGGPGEPAHATPGQIAGMFSDPRLSPSARPLRV